MNLNPKILREHREKNNWTQQHLADLYGVSLRTIQRIEKTGVCSKETASALSSVFEISRDVFVIKPQKNKFLSAELCEYKVAVYILLIAQFIGLFSVVNSISFLTELQFQIAIIAVCSSSLLSFLILGGHIYKKGMLNRLLTST